MKDINQIFRRIFKKENKIYNFKTSSLVTLLLFRISLFFSFMFIILRFEPNKITYLNFFLSLISIILIFIGSANFVSIAIIIFFICYLFDFCDGCIARYFNVSSHYGRFIDGLSDIFLKSFLVLAISYYGFNFLNNKHILIVGSISALLASFDTFVLDRYSALIRWYNQKFNENISPYIYKKIIPNKLSFFYNDAYVLLVGLIFFTNQNEEKLYYNLIFLFGVIIISAMHNIIAHLFFFHKNVKH